MKATILPGTLKKLGLSNTETLCEFLSGRMAKSGIRSEIIKLVDHEILPGTYSDMREGDGWPNILRRVLGSDIVILATPVWWGNQSSEIQRVIERLDERLDEILAGKPSRLEGKVGGVGCLSAASRPTERASTNSWVRGRQRASSSRLRPRASGRHATSKPWDTR